MENDNNPWERDERNESKEMSLNEDLDIKSEICDETEQDYINVSEKCETMLDDYEDQNDPIDEIDDKSSFQSNMEEQIEPKIGQENLKFPAVKKSYQCEICLKSFGKSAHRRRHINTVHSTQRNHKCEFCEQAFKHKDHLTAHKKFKHKEHSKIKSEICEDDEINPWDVFNLEEFLYFCCPECDEKNQSKDMFIKHALNHHPKSKELNY